MKITLSSQEVFIGAMIGARRHIQARQKGLKDQHGMSPEDGWRVHIEGACGEIALAKAINCYYTPTVGTFRATPDVDVYEVRTRSKSHYELIVRKQDKDDGVYVLVRGVAPHYDVVGWIRGSSAKKPEYLKNYGGRPPAYFVPQGKLHPIETLRQGRAK